MALPLAYHWRHVLVRRGPTLLTTLVIASVVTTLAWVLGFAAALSDSLSVARDERKLIVITRGATSESTSALPVEDFNKLNQLPGLARDANGNPLLSPETVVQVALPRLRDGGRTMANVLVRGVTERAFDVHQNVRRLGETFSTGAQEIIVGRRAAQQFQGLGLGEIVNLGYGSNRGYKVVGYFEAGGGPAESEIWGYLPSLLNAYNRTMYSSASLRIGAQANPKDVIEQIEGPAIALTASTERAYWQAQAGNVRIYLGIVGALVLIMGLAAVFAIANTMFAAVAGRTREIAMLRTIGYSPRTIVVGFLTEAVMLALLGGVAGCVACWLWLELVGSTKDMYGQSSFTTMAFDIQLTPAIIATVLLSVTVVGALGALMPAWRASQVDMIAALREA